MLYNSDYKIEEIINIVNTYYISACKSYVTTQYKGPFKRANGCQAYSSRHWSYVKDGGSIQYSVSRFPFSSAARTNCLLAHDLKIVVKFVCGKS